LDQFSNGMSKLHFEGGSDANMDKLTGGFNKATGTDHNFDVLFGKRGENYKRIKKSKESSDPYSSLSSNNDRDFSL